MIEIPNIRGTYKRPKKKINQRTREALAQHAFTPTVWTEDRLKTLERLYVIEGARPAEINLAIPDVTRKQIYDAVREYDLRARRKRYEGRMRHKSSAVIQEMTKKAISEHKAKLEKWAGRAEKTADKAFDMADSSRSPRDLNTSVQAASKSIEIFRRGLGLEEAAARSGPVTLNFYQAGNPLDSLPRAEPVVDVDVPAAESD